MKINTYLGFHYKVLVQMKSHYIATIIGLVLPGLLVWLYMALAGYFAGTGKSVLAETRYGDGPTLEPTPYEILPSQMKKDIAAKISNSTPTIVYVPDNTFTKQLMDVVKKKLDTYPLESDPEISEDKRPAPTGLADESEIMENFNQFNKGNMSDQVFVGLVFDVDKTQDKPPSTLKYKIRTCLEPLTVFSKKLYAGMNPKSTKFYLKNDNVILPMKILIDDAFMELIGVKEATWSLESFPIPDELRLSKMVIPIALYFSLFLTVVFILINMILLTYLIDEKRTGILERIQMVGIPKFSLFFFYALYAVLIGIISTVLITIFLMVGKATLSSNLILIWFYFFIFYMQTSTYLLCFAVFFTSGFFIFIISLVVLLAPLGIFHYARPATLAGQLCGALVPSINLCIAMDIIGSFESIGWPTSFVRVLRTGNYELPMVGLVIMAILTMVIAFFIFYYGMLVRPGPYGSAKHWYFPVQWCVFKVKDWKKRRNSMGDLNPPLYETMPDNLDVGLKILNLRKKFGSFVAVKDLSFDIYDGQITALLGHNGAGKTTTLSILSGMLAPTSGSVFYDGYNIFTDMSRFRQDLGLCPQEDMVLQDFTVKENLKFFGLLRGMSCPASSVSAISSMELVNLFDKRNKKAKKLSGGMKRRLCLALALVGEPKIIILDEPTSGLDPQSRREVWDLLLSLREGRIVILTTHFMEEADTLGDMIAIVDHGELQCYGTSMFLKNHFGAGYQITAYCDDQSRFNEIISTVTSQIPSANVRLVTDDFIVFHAPSKNTSDMIRMYEKLEGTHYISRVGLTSSTMDDVFLKVHEEVEKRTKTDDTAEKETYYEDVLAIRVHSPNFIFGFFQRLCALFLKNLQYLWNWLPLLVSILLVLLVSYMAVTAEKETLRSQEFKIDFDLNIYGHTDVYIFGEEFSDLREGLKRVLKEGSHKVEEKLDEHHPKKALLKIAKTDPETYGTTMIVAADYSDKKEAKIWFNLAATHSVPIAVNLLNNALIKASDNNSSISTIFEPLRSKENCKDIINESVEIMTGRWSPFVWILAIVLDTLRLRNVHDERTSLFKHLQLMAGASPFTYWISFFLMDLLIYAVYMGLMFAMFFAFDSFKFIHIEDVAGSTAFVIFLFGITKMWMVYTFSFLFRTPNVVTILLILLDTIGFVSYQLAWILSRGENVFMNQPLKDPGSMNKSDLACYIIELILAVLPTNSFFAALMEIQAFAFFGYVHKICPEEGVLGSATKSVWSKISRNCGYLGCVAIFFFFLVMLLDWKVFQLLWVCIRSVCRRRRGSPAEEIEPDVAQERENVREAIQDLMEKRRSSSDSQETPKEPAKRRSSSDSPETPKEETPPFIVANLKKVYGLSFTAVNDVSFVLKKGECFGLLGTNGAGKSTTFGMLAGIIVPSDGRMFVRGKDFYFHRDWCLSHLGYCTQENCLAENLSSRQSLTLFAHLRLAHPKFVKRQVNAWINILGLEEYADRRCGTYSGGNKRKLCTAMALINSPAVVLLDEPTSGIDPVARRNLWTALRNYINPARRSSRRLSATWQYPVPSILLSSHSMDECEALCHRLTIMTTGEMRCLGTMGRLRDLYGKGFVILIKLNLGHRSEGDLVKLQDKMNDLFNYKASLKEERVMLLRYHINDHSAKLSSLFNKMERIKSEFDIVEDYSISDLSLEYVFLFFANERRKSRYSKYSASKQARKQ